jgi:hypothetical protein
MVEDIAAIADRCILQKTPVCNPVLWNSGYLIWRWTLCFVTQKDQVVLLGDSPSSVN